MCTRGVPGCPGGVSRGGVPGGYPTGGSGGCPPGPRGVWRSAPPWGWGGTPQTPHRVPSAGGWSPPDPPGPKGPGVGSADPMPPTPLATRSPWHGPRGGLDEAQHRLWVVPRTWWAGPPTPPGLRTAARSGGGFWGSPGGAGPPPPTDRPARIIAQPQRGAVVGPVGGRAMGRGLGVERGVARSGVPEGRASTPPDALQGSLASPFPGGVESCTLDG